WSRVTRARSRRRCRACWISYVGDAIDASLYIVSNIQRAIGANCEPRWAMLRAIRRLYFPGKPVSKNFTVARSVIALKCLEHDVFSAWRVGCRFPQPVKGNKSPTAIPRGNFFLFIVLHPIRPQVGRKYSPRAIFFRPPPTFFPPTPAVLGRENQL